MLISRHFRLAERRQRQAGGRGDGTHRHGGQGPGRGLRAEVEVGKLGVRHREGTQEEKKGIVEVRGEMFRGNKRRLRHINVLLNE